MVEASTFAMVLALWVTVSAVSAQGQTVDVAAAKKEGKVVV